jgi:hypothetical protein
MLGSLGLREIAAPHLRRLTDSTGHTTNLAIRDDTDVILVDRMRGRPGRTTTSNSASTPARGYRLTAPLPARPCWLSCPAPSWTGS